jgi:hypothetical protein
MSEIPMLWNDRLTQESSDRVVILEADNQALRAKIEDQAQEIAILKRELLRWIEEARELAILEIQKEME